jgi:hypothetical protein
VSAASRDSVRIRRRLRADDPADLGTPLYYRVEVLAADDDARRGEVTT